MVGLSDHHRHDSNSLDLVLPIAESEDLSADCKESVAWFVSTSTQKLSALHGQKEVADQILEKKEEWEPRRHVVTWLRFNKHTRTRALI